jgi:hypothetical protein
MRAGLRSAELEVLNAAQKLVDFDLLLPARIPRPYGLVAFEHVPNSRDIATLVFQEPGRGADHRRRTFRLTERLHMLSLPQELLATKVPVLAGRYAGRDFAVVPGAFVGEPIDGRRWHSTRRSVCWEQGSLICELQEVIDSGPSLTILLRVAASVALPAAVSSLRAAHHRYEEPLRWVARRKKGWRVR